LKFQHHHLVNQEISRGATELVINHFKSKNAVCCIIKTFYVWQQRADAVLLLLDSFKITTTQHISTLRTSLVACKIVIESHQHYIVILVIRFSLHITGNLIGVFSLKCVIIICWNVDTECTGRGDQQN